jgi:hypothetical protein
MVRKKAQYFDNSNPGGASIPGVKFTGDLTAADTQSTARGYTVPVPSRDDVIADLHRVAGRRSTSGASRAADQ